MPPPPGSLNYFCMWARVCGSQMSSLVPLCGTGNLTLVAWCGGRRLYLLLRLTDPSVSYDVRIKSWTLYS